MSDEVSLAKAEQYARAIWARLPKNYKKNLEEQAGELFAFFEQLQDLAEGYDEGEVFLPFWLTESE